MKRKTVGILLGMMIAAVSIAGCSSNEATEAANESAEIEKEANGEDAETEAAGEKAEEDKEASDDAEAEAAETEEPALKVGVFLPDDSEEDWSFDGMQLESLLEDDGYEVELVYAEGDSARQASQILEMAEEEISAMIIAPVDEYGLTEALEQTKEKGIYVFSYDKLIRDSDGVNYYATFSGRSAGRALGEEIVKEQELEKAREAQESRTIEFLMGSQDDMQALFLYNGVMEILQPYLDDGTLVCRSGRTSFEDTGVLRWGRDRAGAVLEEILEEFYQDIRTPDMICTGFDEAACGAVDALEEAGLLASGENWPMITGFGCEAEAVKNIAEGKIFCSVFMDRRDLAEECVKMVDTYLKGEKPEVNNYEEYDNGKKIIGTYICDLQLINAGNYESLIDNGYYPEEEIRPDDPMTEEVSEDEAEEETEDETAGEEADENSILSILGNAKENL